MHHRLEAAPLKLPTPRLRAPARQLPARPFIAILLAFFLIGLQSGAWVVLLADLATAVGVDAGRLGVALTGMSGAGIVALLFGGRLADLLPRRPLLVVALLGAAAFFLLLATVNGYARMVATFALGGLFLSLLDLMANALGGDFEHQHRRRVLTFFHAAWSLGAALGALLSGAALAADVPYAALYRGLAGVLALGACLAAPAPLPRRGRAERGLEPSGERVLAVRGVLVAALLVVSAFATDAALEGYVSLYLRELVGSGPLPRGVSISLLYGAAVVGRLTSGVAVGRFGEGRVLRFSGALACLGLVPVTASTATAPVAAGLLLIGLALSPVAPVAYSLAARSAPGRVGRAASIVTIFGYGAFLVTPLVVGGVAALTSLRAAFALLFVTGLGIALLARFASAPRGREGAREGA